MMVTLFATEDQGRGLSSLGGASAMSHLLVPSTHAQSGTYAPGKSPVSSLFRNLIVYAIRKLAAFASIVLLLMFITRTTRAETLLKNGGLEDVGPNGVPTSWRPMITPQPTWVSAQHVRTGKFAGQLCGDKKEHFLRQVIPSPATRIYSARGWFKGENIKIDSANGDYIHFYFHILYKDRPYGDTTHIWKDPPTGTFNWQPLVVRLTPRTDWPIKEIWFTVAGRFSGGTLWFDDLSLEPAAPLTGYVALEWKNHDKAVILSDMSKCHPASALSAKARRGYWHLIPYDTGKMKGNLVWANFGTTPPEIRLPFRAKGWYAIFLGMFKPGGIDSRLWVKLGKDAAPVARQAQRTYIQEIFFKVANLNRDDLVFKPQSTGMRCGGGLAYVKLIPLTKQESNAVLAKRTEQKKRRLTTSIDGFSFIYNRRPTTKEELLAEVEPFRHTDFDLLVLQMGCADQTNYPSKVGEMIGERAEDFARPGDQYYAEAVRDLAREKINPTKLLIDGAHNVGMRVHVSIRPAAWIHTEPMSEFYASRFYMDHPEWHCVDRDGTPVARMSLAVPEVRRHLVDVLREAVRFGADGANVIFVRGVPVVLFEKPFVDLFHKKYGVDPRTIDENDPRILALHCEIVTTFMRDIRAMLDEEGRRRDGQKHLELSAYVLANESDNRRYGIDLRKWTKEKLVDLVMPYLHAGGSRAKTYDMNFFKSVCSQHGVPVRPTFVTWHITNLDRLARDGFKLYEQGADGISFWDANAAVYHLDHWALVSNFGHVDILKQFVEAGTPRAVQIRIHSLGGLIINGRFSPNWGF